MCDGGVVSVMGSGEYALPTVRLLWTASTCTTCWRSGECDGVVVSM